MCAAVTTARLLVVFAMLSSTRLVSEGLPAKWRELSYHRDDIISGDEFLTIFLRSRLQEARRGAVEDPETTTPAALLDVDNDLAGDDDDERHRHTRSTSFLVVSQPPQERSSGEAETTTEEAATTTTEAPAAAEEERPGIFAEVNKSEFNVEEAEPVTGTDPQEYPAEVKAIPDPNVQSVKHQTVVFHGPEGAEGARSVSYSTVIQELPQQAVIRNWNMDFEQMQRDKEILNKTTSQEKFLQDGLVIQDGNNKIVLRKIDDTPSSTDNSWEREKSTPQRPIVYGQPEQNYEIDESVSVVTNGRTHGVQKVGAAAAAATPPLEEKPAAENPNGQKVGYVVEGRNYRKYRVEERTSDGFIVGEYGVVSHDDGSLRGVRYTADGTINPSVIYDALMKFLSL